MSAAYPKRTDTEGWVYGQDVSHTWSDSQTLASLGRLAKGTSKTALRFRLRVFRQLKDIYEQTEEVLKTEGRMDAAITKDIRRFGSIHDNAGEYYI